MESVMEDVIDQESSTNLPSWPDEMADAYCRSSKEEHNVEKIEGEE